MGILVNKKETLKNDVLFNKILTKFKVSIKRNKDGKKETVFPKNWNLIDSNTCDGNEKNIAFITGTINNITVIDFDDIESRNWFEENIGLFNKMKAHRVKTTNGYHLYFKYSLDLDRIISTYTKKKVKVIKNIDVRSNGNCIFYGNGYELEHYENELSIVPKEFIDILQVHFEQTSNQDQTQTLVQTTLCENNVVLFDLKESIDDISYILNNLNIERCINFDDWMKVAICLKHSFGETYKDTWLKWSKKSTIHKPFFDLNEKYWDNIKDGSLTIASVYDMLKKDNKKAFYKLINEKKPEIEKCSTSMLFGDYTQFVNQIVEQYEVELFFKSTLRFVINKGNTCWAVKVKDENDDIRWNVVNKFPCGVDGYKFETEKTIMFIKFEHLIDTFKKDITKQNVVFSPYSPTFDYDFDRDTNINLFAGWKLNYQKDLVVDLKILEPILHHIRKVFCIEQEDLFEYMINWIATIIQKPKSKTSVCPCFISDQQGAGKNLFWDWLGKEIFGTSYQYVSDIETIFAKFNKRFENSLLIACDEISSNGMAYKQNNQLKSIITQEKQSIEPKGMEAYQIYDYRNYVMLSNNEHIVKVENSDRRYVMFECDNCYVGNFDYFKELKACMENDIVKQHFFHFLIQRDLTDFVIKKIPNTELRKRVMGLSVPNHIKFLEHFSSTLDTELKLTATQLYTYYQIFIKNFEGNFGLQTSRKFGLEIGKYLEKKKSNGCNQYTISKDIVIQTLKVYYKDPSFDIDSIGPIDIYNPNSEDYRKILHQK